MENNSAGQGEWRRTRLVGTAAGLSHKHSTVTDRLEKASRCAQSEWPKGIKRARESGGESAERSKRRWQRSTGEAEGCERGRKLQDREKGRERAGARGRARERQQQKGEKQKRRRERETNTQKKRRYTFQVHRSGSPPLSQPQREPTAAASPRTTPARLYSHCAPAHARPQCRRWQRNGPSFVVPQALPSLPPARRACRSVPAVRCLLSARGDEAAEGAHTDTGGKLRRSSSTVCKVARKRRAKKVKAKPG